MQINNRIMVSRSAVRCRRSSGEIFGFTGGRLISRMFRIGDQLDQVHAGNVAAYKTIPDGD
jgi:hypothetical protein